MVIVLEMSNFSYIASISSWLGFNNCPASGRGGEEIILADDVAVFTCGSSLVGKENCLLVLLEELFLKSRTITIQ